MKTNRREFPRNIWLLVLGAVAWLTASTALATPCIAPDNGGGTATLPPAGCNYQGDMMQIIDGLPAGATIDMAGPTLGGFFSISDVPGGSLGGNLQDYGAILMLQMNGTGALAGFNRLINVNLPDGVSTNQMASAPRTPGTSPQSFNTEVFRLIGQITGDPDFDLLRITGGTDFALPSPGHTTLTSVPGGGNWNVDSFFDITFRIDFIGAPGGSLEGRSGSTTGTAHFVLGEQARPIPEPSALALQGMGSILMWVLAWRRRLGLA